MSKQDTPVINPPADAEEFVDRHYEDMQHKLDEAILDLLMLVGSQHTALERDPHDIGAALDLEAVSTVLSRVVDVHNALGERRQTEESHRAAWPHIVERLEAEQSALPEPRWVVEDDGSWTDEAASGEDAS